MAGYNATITGIVKLGPGQISCGDWSATGNCLTINGILNSNSSSTLAFVRPNQFNAAIVVDGIPGILGSSIIMDFRPYIPVANVQYQLVSSINYNNINYLANRIADNIIYSKTTDTPTYKISVVGKQMFIQFGKSCVSPTVCDGHAICNNGMCQCDTYYQDPGCSVLGCLKNCSGHGECIVPGPAGICQCQSDYVGSYCERPSSFCTTLTSSDACAAVRGCHWCTSINTCQRPSATCGAPTSTSTTTASTTATTATTTATTTASITTTTGNHPSTASTTTTPTIVVIFRIGRCLL
ncbi:hypothetical protein SAMD00019534_029840 [Acytostelium subglobosum LB1]|uniref:hypothetical protein n=1 Tax=Acytostelium subglobosum LB1 TaxID=1410327 RepID=UPI00064500D8|nr:hypothetical protein SAMD00019534_029840 [Acytostelium subglobosum LB1]GAM19809.1 hypothetical protein SAMD00019534_029840 [Acytostelium subglobosum LB1]|eukprot:XP_012756571.1 hypothetical protein SAMD00019534_029840 [Acytostelium subglobosum LB1]